MIEHEKLQAMPMTLRWLAPPVSWHKEGSTLSLVAGPRTDWFVDPSRSREPVLNSPALVGEAAGDYVFSARVSVRFKSVFDAGVLMLYVAERVWAKLCFEYSPNKDPMIVSVVTRGTSDDATGFAVAGEEAWLRIARLGPAFAFHASSDGYEWHLVRHFALGGDVEPAVGFEAQSPTGEGCEVRFEEIRFEAVRLRDLRDGS
jgi:regulation of enolase protein 1 (concanavalin A-like superfamily)